MFVNLECKMTTVIQLEEALIKHIFPLLEEFPKNTVILFKQDSKWHIATANSVEDESNM